MAAKKKQPIAHMCVKVPIVLSREQQNEARVMMARSLNARNSYVLADKGLKHLDANMIVDHIDKACASLTATRYLLISFDIMEDGSFDDYDIVWEEKTD